jgi:hypothetical protein
MKHGGNCKYSKRMVLPATFDESISNRYSWKNTESKKMFKRILSQK